MDEKREVNFTGKEYLEYLKYKDSFKKPMSDKMKLGILFGSILVGVVLVIALIVDTMTPATPVNWNYTWEGIGMFVAICVGISWMIHGTGFFLVKVR